LPWVEPLSTEPGEVELRTVKTHLNRLMAKLGISSRAQAVVVAYETGLVSPGDTRTRCARPNT
jgi:regulatory LuxR family protein